MEFPNDPSALILTLPGVDWRVCSWPITADAQSIGRAADCAIRMGDRSVSRRHADVRYEGDGAIVRDLQSVNGTRVNGVRVKQQQPLRCGDQLQLGENLIFELNQPQGSAVREQKADEDPSLTEAAEWGAELVELWRQAQPDNDDDFSTLYAGALAIRGCDELDLAAGRLAEWLLDWLDAERALVLLAEAEGTTRVLARRALSGSTDPVDFDSALVQQSLAQRATVVRPPGDDREWHGRVSAAVPFGSGPHGALFIEWSKIDRPRAARIVSLAAEVFGKRIERSAPIVSHDASAAAGQSSLIGGPALDEVRQAIIRSADSDLTVLITGETGTGKEVVARAIHAASRAEGPLVACNCAAIAEALLESELFGHEKGAFSGADQRHRGLFEQADGGTLLLDEIGETTLELQAKLLRVLQERTVQRVGGEKISRVNVRIIASTNRDLLKDVQRRAFRRDLFYRLDELQIHLPPLRQHPEDIAILADHFLGKYAPRRMRFSPAALDKLREQPWPGNVRELESVIKRAVLLSDSDTIERGQLQIRVAFDEADDDNAPTVKRRADDLEREHILRVLDSVDGNKTRAADILGIDRGTLRRKLKKWQR